MDWTFNVSNLLALISFSVLGIGFMYTMKMDMRVGSEKLRNIERDVSEVRVAIVQIARQDERITALDKRIVLQGERLDATQKDVNEIVRRKTAA